MNIPKLPEKPIPNTYCGSAMQCSGKYKEAFSTECINKWYAMLEAWHANIFDGAVEVYNHDGNGLCARDWRNKHDAPNPTHKALLINIQPIAEETAEDILKEIVYWCEKRGISEQEASFEFINSLDKAKAYLEKKK